MIVIQCGMNVCCQGGDGSDSDSMWYMSSSDSEGSDDNVNKYTGPMTADHFLKKYGLSCVHSPPPFVFYSVLPKTLTKKLYSYLTLCTHILENGQKKESHGN